MRLTVYACVLRSQNFGTQETESGKENETRKAYDIICHYLYLYIKMVLAQVMPSQTLHGNRSIQNIFL